MYKKIISILKSKVYVYNEKLETYLEDIDEICTNFNKNVLNSSQKNNLFITKKNLGIEVCLLILLVLDIYIQEIDYLKYNDYDYILSNFEIGDIVIYKGKKYKYIGCQKIYDVKEFNGDEKIILQARGKSERYMINKNEVCKISRYYGNSSRLDSMETKKDTSKERFLISDFLGEGFKKLNYILNEQIIVVFKSKYRIDEFISNVSIEINEKIYMFGKVFPAIYYSSADNEGIPIKGNKFYKNPIFLFTSRFDVANSLLRSNKHCKKIIFLENESYSDSISYIEDYLLKKENLKKIIFYNNYNDISSTQNLIKQNVQVCAIDNKISPWKNLTKNILIEDKNINQLFYIIRKNLMNLTNSENDFIDKEIFIKNAFRLLKIFRWSCVPLRDLNEDYKLEESLNLLKYIERDNIEYRSMYIKIVDFVSNLEKLYNILYNFNPKVKILNQITDRNSIIVINNIDELKSISKYIIGSYKKIELVKNIGNLDLKNQKLIFISFYGDKDLSQFNIYSSNNVKNILYYIDANKYNYLANNLNNKLKDIYLHNINNFNFKEKYIDLISYDINLLKLKDKEKKVYTQIYDANEDINNEDEFYEKECFYSNMENDDFNFLKKTQNLKNKYFNLNHKNIEASKVKAYKKIIFKNKQYAYLSKNYRASCIDINGNYIVKYTDSLEINDSIIFNNNKTNDDIDIMFEKIILSDIFKQKYYDDFKNVEYFKNKIRDYIEIYGEDLLSAELSDLYHISRSPIAVKQWCSYKIVGPNEKEIYKVIGNILRDDKLKREWEEIYHSIEIIRSFRTKFKNVFKHITTNNNIEESDNELVKLIVDVFDDLDEYIDIVEISQIIYIYDEEIDEKINCLLG